MASRPLSKPLDRAFMAEVMAELEVLIRIGLVIGSNKSVAFTVSIIEAIHDANAQTWN